MIVRDDTREAGFIGVHCRCSVIRQIDSADTDIHIREENKTMKTIKQLLSNYLRERREIITGERVLVVGIVIAVAIVACAAFIVLGIDLAKVNPTVLFGIGILGYLVWIVFFRKARK